MKGGDKDDTWRYSDKESGRNFGNECKQECVERRLNSLGKNLTTASRQDFLEVLDDIEKTTLTAMLGGGVAKTRIDQIRAVI